MLHLRHLTAARQAYVLGPWILGFVLAGDLGAQSVITGRIVDVTSRAPLATVLVEVEGTQLRAITTADGRYRLAGVPAGPVVMRAERIGYAPARVTLTAPVAGEITRDFEMATSPLRTEGLIVTADPQGRARGELGTATVIDREAIRHQAAASLAGMLELVPGVPVQPPGLDGIQQISLRSAPTSSIGLESLGPGAADLASMGTLIVLDGVPLSNNANLQSLGPGGELTFATSAGGGVDLRRIPATLVERVEVIRGIPSARYGDLTQGAIVVDTRAGAVEPELAVRRDEATTEASTVAGTLFKDAHAVTGSFNIARTLLTPGVRDDYSYRVAGQAAYRATLGSQSRGPGVLTLDTRLDFYSLERELKAIPEVGLVSASKTEDAGLRLMHRARLECASGTAYELTASLGRERQQSTRSALLERGALPFTDRLTEGRSIGRFVGGSYLSGLEVDGEPWLVFIRAETTRHATWLGFEHGVRAGGELRREWNSGLGYQFDMESPPQVTFNGVQGFSRPRSFRDIPALATSTLYLDDRFTRTLGGTMYLAVQAGLRLDVLNEGGSWFGSARDAVLQPRLQAEFAPTPSLRLRAGVGRTSKYPTVSQLHPAPQYNDVVNVNWYANDPAERLAVVTTFITDPGNAELRQQTATKSEVGIDVALGSDGGALSLAIFRDRIDNGIGIQRIPMSLPKDSYQLADSTFGTGRPPEIIEPPSSTAPVPILLLQPANTLTMENRGAELTLTFPELRFLRTRVQVDAAWVHSRIESDGIEVGTYFNEFQLQDLRVRTPYWDGSTRTGERVILNYRLIHHQPAVGLAITASVQHTPYEWTRNLAATDSLEFAGYITRDGTVVPINEPERAAPEYVDIQRPRGNILTDRLRVPGEWLLSVQVSKTLPREGRLSFYAFNALDREGTPARPGWLGRLHPSMRFGLELTLVPAAFFR